jgi:plasmid maintenance system antidote protein VapI
MWTVSWTGGTAQAGDIRDLRALGYRVSAGRNLGQASVLMVRRRSSVRAGNHQYRLAQATGLPQTRISEIVQAGAGSRPIPRRFSRALRLSERYWINMQTDYDIETEHDLHGEDLRRVEVLVSL